MDQQIVEFQVYEIPEAIYAEKESQLNRSYQDIGEEDIQAEKETYKLIGSTEFTLDSVIIKMLRQGGPLNECTIGMTKNLRKGKQLSLSNAQEQRAPTLGMQFSNLLTLDSEGVERLNHAKERQRRAIATKLKGLQAKAAKLQGHIE